MRALRLALVARLVAGSGIIVGACETEGGYRKPPPDWPPRRTPGGSG